MAVSIVKTQQFSWAGNYPLNFAGTVTDIGAGSTLALLFFSVGPSYDVASLRPAVTLGGVTATYVGAFSNAAAGTTWVYAVKNPTNGSVTASISNAYVGDGRMTIVSLSGTDDASPIGAVTFAGINATGATTTSTLTTTAANSLVITHGNGIYGGTPSNTGGSPAVTQFLADDSVSNRILRGWSQAPGAAGTVVTGSWNNTYNQAVFSVIEVKAGGGAPAQSVTPSGRASTAALGSPTVSASLNKRVAPTGIASTNAFGTAVARYPQTVAMTGLKSGGMGSPSVAAVSEQSPWTLAGAGTVFTVARTGAATYFDASRVLQAVAASGARQMHDDGFSLGVMAEEASTNLITDNTASAAVVAGAYPTGGGWYNGGVAGLTCVVAGKGVEDGIEYVDLRFQGTNSGVEAYPSYNMSGLLNAPVVNGDVLTLSAYCRVVAGTGVRASDGYPLASLGINVHDSAQGYLASLTNFQPILQTDKLEREWTTATVGNASAAYANALVALTVPAGATIDFTLRLGLPQLEKKTRPTSVIKTAGSAAVSRGAETLTALLPSGTGQTIYVERVGYTGLQKIVTYSAQTISSGQWVVPADVDFPYVRRVSRSVLTNQRAKAVTTASGKNWLFGSAFKLTDYNASTAYANLLKDEAAIYCPEYEFKMDQVQPTTEGTFTWTVADNFAARAVADGKLLRGHALIWHIATPAWANTVLNGTPTTARWQGMIESMAANVMPRWACSTWDVVNEVIEPVDGLANGMRNSPWYKAAGPAYVAYAFHRAAAHNTHGAKLYIAEYGMEENDAQAQARRTHFLNLITNLVNDGVPIDGVALQAHLDIERPFSKSAFTTFLNSIKALGLEVVLSEIDVRAPAQDTTLQYDLRAARRMRQVLDCFQAVTTGREIVFWNLNDSYSWLTAEFPTRTQRPLPFDTTNTPKALYAALQQAFEMNKSADVVVAQTITMAGLASSTAIGSATVARVNPTQTVSPAGRASSAAIGSAKVSHIVRATGKASSAALGTQKVNHMVRATGKASSAALGTHKTILVVKPTGKASSAALGTHKAVLGVKPAGIASGARFGTTKVNHVVRATGKASSAAFGTAKITHVIRALGKASSISFGVQKVIQKANLGGISSTASLGTHKIVHRLAMQGKASGALLGTLAVKATTALVIPSISPSGNLGVFVVSKGGVNLLPSGIARTSALGTPSVARGRVTASPSGIVSTARFGSHVVKLIVRATGLAVGSALGTQTVRSVYALGPSGISSASALGQPSFLRGAAQITANGLPTSVSLGTPQVTTGARIVSTPGIASSAQVGSPAITPGKVTVSAAGRASSAALGTASVARGRVTVSAVGKASSLSFGTAKLSHRLAVAGIASGARFGTGKIVSRVTVSGVTKTSGLGTPRATLVLKMSGKPSSAVLGASTLSTGKVTVSPTGIKSGAVGTPLILTGALIMVPVSIPPGSRFGTPAVLRGAVSISVQGIAPTSGVGSPRASAGGATIAPAGLASNARFGTHALTSRVSLVVPGIALTSATGALTVRAVSRIFSTGIAPATALGSLKIAHKTYVMSILGRRAFGTAQVLPGVRTVSAPGIASTTQMGGATVLKGAAGIRPSGIAPKAALGIAALSTGPVSVRPGSIPTGSRFGSGTVKHRIAAMGIDSTAAFGQLRIEVGPISLGAQGIPPRSAAGAPSVLRGRVTVQAHGIARTSGLGEHTVIRQTIVAVPGIASGARFGVTILRTSAVQVSPLSITSLGAMGLPYVFVGERPIGKPAMIFRVQGTQWKMKVPNTQTFKFKVPRRAK